MRRSMITVSMLVLGAVLSGCYFSERKISKEIIARVDQFRKSTGHLPETLSDIGIEENESCPCYCKTSSDSYMVWYGTTLGESNTYNSRTKRWSEVAGLVCAAKAPVLTN